MHSLYKVHKVIACKGGCVSLSACYASDATQWTFYYYYYLIDDLCGLVVGSPWLQN
jgi:hypothetical protein